MSNILAALEQLDELEAEKKQRDKRKGKKKVSSSYVSPGARKSRPTSLPPAKNQDGLQPPGTAHSERSPSIGADSARRISFADPPRPGARKIWIPTKTDSLASGFVYDARLNKYGVSEAEWAHFNKEVIEVADVPGPSWAWSFNRKNVIKKMKRELQYEGDLKRLLRKWNKLFKRQGFSVSLELPVAKGEADTSEELIGDTQEERDKAKRDAKRFRVVVNGDPDKATSVYSRSSSLNRSVSGEGIAVQHDKVPDIDDTKDDAAGTEDG